MNPVFSYLSTAAAAVCLALGVWFFALSHGNQAVQQNLQQLQQEAQTQQQILQGQQRQLQTQQEQINTGTAISQQVGPALLRDMAVASTQNQEMKAILTKHGYSVEMNANGAEPAASPVSQP